VAVHFHALTIKDLRRETPDCVSIAFEIPEHLKDAFQFNQGQNITVRTTLNNQELRRSYSICSFPFDKELRVAVKQSVQGLFSTFANKQLKKGDILEVLPPTGRFFTELNAANKKNYLAFAAGSGITPVISIIKTTLRAEPSSSFTLIYGNRNRSSIIFCEELEGLKNKYIERFNLIHILSREATEAPLLSGRINPDKCASLGEKLVTFTDMDEIFICGPEAMLFAVKNWLEQNGIDKKKIHFELFTTPGQDKQPGVGSRELAVYPGQSGVTVKIDGRSIDFDLAFDGDVILNAACKQGADLPFSCKGGVCGTCRAKLMEGKVEMEVNYALEPEEVERGYILTCQSHPTTDRVIVDFDAR
jgi:ring-1,2-phenylacetyl-CoA epoxidase subunit PaaE